MPVDVLPGAKHDLRLLRESDPDALAVIVTFLAEANAEAHDSLVDKCASHGEVSIGSNRVGVKPWRDARHGGHNLFRFRIFDTPATSYRIVYGFDWHTRRIGLLAVVHKKDFDYGLSSELAIRIQADWDFATDGRRT